jgi:hypothetical protein
MAVGIEKPVVTVVAIDIILILFFGIVGKPFRLRKYRFPHGNNGRLRAILGMTGAAAKSTLAAEFSAFGVSEQAPHRALRLSENRCL